MIKKILVVGPALSQTGYGEQCRFALRSLLSRDDLFDVYLKPITWGKSSWLLPNDQDRKWIDPLIHKGALHEQSGGSFDMSLQVTIPNEWEKLAPVNVGYTAGIETTRVSPQWIEKSRLMDRIITISNHSKNVFVETAYEASNPNTGEQFVFKCTTPIEVVHYPVRNFNNAKIELNLQHEFNFLTVSQWGPRKNLENTIRWWVEEFKDEEVGLIVKTNLMKTSIIDRVHTENRLSSLLSNYVDRKCKVYLLHGNMTPEELTSLYQHPKVKCFVSLTHGEGFGLPLFEAAYNSLPIIAPNWSGHIDFLSAPKKVKKNKKSVIKEKPHFLKVEHDLRQVQKEVVWEGVIQSDALWCYPKQSSYKLQLRNIYNNYNRFASMAKNLKSHIEKTFVPEDKYEHFAAYTYGQSVKKLTVKDLPKISLITSVFDAEEHIDQLMENVTKQTIFQDKCEWIILNANPLEKNYEEEVILKYVEKYPKNIIYKRLDNDPGVYGTWNEAIRLATGEFVTNINCDDRRALWALEKQARSLVTNPDVDLVYNDSYIVHESNTNWGDIDPVSTQRYNFDEFSKDAMLRGNLPHNNPMWRKQIHDKHGMFDDKYKSAGDWEFWLRCVFAGSKFKKLPDVLGIYYFNPNGISTNPENNSWKQKEEKEVFMKYRKINKENLNQGLIL
jgi:glycosyltransferase involved in cell wall biosynthesis